MDIGAITAAYNGLKAGKEILSAVIDLKIEADSKSKILEVLGKLGQAQDTLFELREELFKLQEQNNELRQRVSLHNDWRDKLGAYELQRTGGGAVVYVSRSEPTHYICPSCVNKKEIHFLQDNRTYSGKFRCTGCAAEYPVNQRRDAN